MPAGDQYDEYDDASVGAARSAIIELMTVLGEYREELVLVGGWVPFLAIDAPEDPLDRHPGSADVDIVLDHEELKEVGYETIARRLEDAGYEQVGEQPFQFSKTVNGVVVHIDLLAGQYAGTGKKHRTQKIQDVKARKARGADLVFQIGPDKREISGQLPDGSHDRVIVPIASVVPFIIMKSFAMEDRMKPKDPFDIWYVMKRYPGGVDALIETFRPHLGHGLVKQGLGILARKFERFDSWASTQVGKFDSALSFDGQERRQRDAYERIEYLLTALGFGRS
jgi:hypothetical protein